MKLNVGACAALACTCLLAGCQHFEPEPISAGSTLETLESRSLENSGLKAFLEKNAPTPLPQWPLGSWDFEHLFLVALYYHPNLEIARADWNLAQAGVTTAGGRLNPSVTVTPEYNFNAASGVSPWLPAVSFDVPIETGGKRGYRQARAKHLSEAARLKIAAAAWLVRSNLRTALLDYSVAQERQTRLRQQAAIHDKLVAQMQARFAAGAVSSFELSAARLAQARAQVEADDLRRQVAEARARVAQGLGIPASALAKVSLEPLLKTSQDALLKPEIRRAALQHRADILSALSEYAASESALQLELARQYPDVHLGTGYQWDQGENKWALGATVDIPVLNRNEGPIAEAKAARSASAARFEALQAGVMAEIDRALANYQGALEHLKVLDHLLATQEKQRSAVEAQFTAGLSDQLDVLNAQAESVTAELLSLDAKAKMLQAFGQLEDALQQPFDTLRIVEQSSYRTPKINK